VRIHPNTVKLKPIGSTCLDNEDVKIQETELDGYVVNKTLGMRWWGIIMGMVEDFYICKLQNIDTLATIHKDDIELYIRRDLAPIPLKDKP
jgi:hypothetical protein